MRIEKNQLHLASLLTQHVLKELVPSGYLQEAYVDPFSFNLILEIPVEMQSEMKEFIERRIAEISPDVSVKEMLESNARDYLESLSEKKLAKKLDRSGRHVVSVVECQGKVFLSFDECASSIGAVSILEFETWHDDLWLVRGTTSHSKQELQKRKKLYSQNKRREFKRRGHDEKFFLFSSMGTKWYQDGLICQERVKNALREVYNTLDIKQVSSERVLEEYALEECEDSMFPGSHCFGDFAETERISIQDEALSEAKNALIQLGIPEGRIDIKGESVNVQDVMGIWRETSKVSKKKGQEVPFLRLQIFRSIERVVALLLELSNV